MVAKAFTAICVLHQRKNEICLLTVYSFIIDFTEIVTEKRPCNVSVFINHGTTISRPGRYFLAYLSLLSTGKHQACKQGYVSDRCQTWITTKTKVSKVTVIGPMIREFSYLSSLLCNAIQQQQRIQILQMLSDIRAAMFCLQTA